MVQYLLNVDDERMSFVIRFYIVMLPTAYKMIVFTQEAHVEDEAQLRIIAQPYCWIRDCLSKFQAEKQLI